MHSNFSNNDKIAQAVPQRHISLPESCLAHAKMCMWECGNTIVQYDDSVDGIYYVVCGEVHLNRLLEQGFRKTLHVVQAGHFFLEGLYFWPEQRAITAHAHTACHTAFFARNTVTKLVEQNQDFRVALFQSLAAKAINVGYEVVEMAYSDARSRMEQLLRELAQKQGDEQTHSIEIPISQTELAERLGLHPVSVNRVLRKLESEELVTTGRQRILIHKLLWENKR